MHLSTLLAFVPLALAAPATVNSRAPILRPRNGQIIPGKYIVKLKDGVAEGTLDTVLGKLGSAKADHVYKDSFKGFASAIDNEALQAIQDIPEVRIKPVKQFIQCMFLTVVTGRLH